MQGGVSVLGLEPCFPVVTDETLHSFALSFLSERLCWGKHFSGVVGDW